MVLQVLLWSIFSTFHTDRAPYSLKNNVTFCIRAADILKYKQTTKKKKVHYLFKMQDLPNE